MTLAAVIFDMDGLMFDSERAAREAWRAALAAHGHDLDDAVYLRAVGRTAAEARQVFVDAYGQDLPVAAVEADKAARLTELLHPTPPLKPGLVELLDVIAGLGLPAAVASATAQPEVRRRLAAAGLQDRFAAVVGGDEVAAGKPAPDLFLRAAALLGAPPAGCVVLEDSEAGIRAAAAAGMIPVMVPDLVPPSPECVGLCESVVGTLSGAAVVILALAHAGRRAGRRVPRPLRPFGTLDGFFAAVNDLVDRLRRDGRTAAAAELARGLSLLNGLTDGWARLLESVERVRDEWGTELGRDEMRRLAQIQAVARSAVRRR